MADVLLIESTLMLEEKFPAILSEFPNVKVKKCKSDQLYEAGYTVQRNNKRHLLNALY